MSNLNAPFTSEGLPDTKEIIQKTGIGKDLKNSGQRDKK